MYCKEIKDDEAREFIRFANGRREEPVVVNVNDVVFVVTVFSSINDPGEDWCAYIALDAEGNILGARRERGY